MKRHFRYILALSIGLLSVFGAMLLSATAVFASSATSDPVVVVAVGSVLPLSDCTDEVTYYAGTPHAITKIEACEMPAIQVRSEQVHLSQAVANHEAYVILPASNASQATLKKAEEQMYALMESTGSALRRTLGQYNIKPYNPCETGTHTTHWYNWTPNGVSVVVTVVWNESYDCSTIFIDNVALQGLNAPNAMYWGHTQYAGGWWDEHCAYIGTNTLHQYINSSQPANYTLEPWVSDGSNCTWFDNYWYTDIPLS